MIRSFCFLPLVLFSFLVAQAPKYEVRGVWISTASGDWPKSWNSKEQQRSLIEIFDVLKENNFNTVYFQVRPRGNVLYRSEYEPWATQLTGILGKDPGYDPLLFAIDEAHKRGLEIHAWFNVAKVWGTEFLPMNKQHITRAHRDWVKLFKNEWWMDMGIPEARVYTEDLVKELVTSYDLDGIHFDYIRYPSEQFEDWKTFIQWGDGMDRDNWRRNNVTAFVRDIYTFVQKERPWIKVGSAPLGIYQSITGAQSSFNGFEGVFQDSRAWLREGIHDYLAPQIYWTIGEQKNPNDPDFSALSADWVQDNSGRHVYIGIGAYRNNIQEEVLDQILIAREKGAQGQVFFRNDNITEILDQTSKLYSSPALLPPMAWKDSIPPETPKDIVVRSENGVANIQWKEPKSSTDNEKPVRYVLYRSESNEIDTRKSQNIVAILPASQLSYQDKWNEGKEYFYTVTAVDRAGNENLNQIKSITDNSTILDRYSTVLSDLSLSLSISTITDGNTFISYDLPQRLPVIISLMSGSPANETVIAKDTVDAGSHIIFVDPNYLSPGVITCRLRAGTMIMEKSIEIQ